MHSDTGQHHTHVVLLFSTCVLLKVMLCGAEVSALDVNGCSPIFYSVALGYVDATRFGQAIFIIQKFTQTQFSEC